MQRETTGYEIVFIGHLSKDINVMPSGECEISPGGGAYYGAFAVKALGCNCALITKVAREDRNLFGELEEFGVDVIWIDSKASTSIENIYPSNNPDERISRVVSRAEPFNKEDLRVSADVIHVTPLWHGEFPEELMLFLKDSGATISTDAQGFLRNVGENGEMFYGNLSDFRVLKYVDILKLDINEGKILTGFGDPEKILKTVEELGPSEIILTRNDGVFLRKNGKTLFSEFGKYDVRGRTGRGDTCIAAYLCLRNKERDDERLVKMVAQVVTKKLQKPGPYKG